MANAQQMADFNRRTSGNTSPPTPVKELPKPSEMLSEFATTPKRKEALQALDAANEDWRKSLRFGGGQPAVAAGGGGTTTVVSSTPGPPGPPGPPGADASDRVLNTDDGLYYRWVPRSGSGGVVTGQWVPA